MPAVTVTVKAPDSPLSPRPSAPAAAADEQRAKTGARAVPPARVWAQAATHGTALTLTEANGQAVHAVEDLDHEVTYSTVLARGKRFSEVLADHDDAGGDRDDMLFRRTGAGLLFEGGVELAERTAAISSALTMGYGFGASVDPKRVSARLERHTIGAGAPLGALIDTLPHVMERLPPPVAALVERLRDSPLGVATTEALVAGAMRLVAGGAMSATFVRADAFDASRVCVAACAFDSGAVIDADGVARARVTVLDGGRVARVQFTESYDQTVSDMKRMLDLVRRTMTLRQCRDRGDAADTEAGGDDASEAGDDVGGAAAAENEIAAEVGNDVGGAAAAKDETTAEVDAEDDAADEHEDEELTVTGLERACEVEATEIRVGVSPHGWYPVQAKFALAASHELIVEMDDGFLWSVRIADGEGDNAVARLLDEMLSVLLLLDALFGMKSATDRLVLALGCPIDHAGVTSRRLCSCYLALTPAQEGLDWAAIDHVICVRPGEDNLALTYIHKEANFEELEHVVMNSSPGECLGSAVALAAAAVVWLNTEYDAISTLMIALPLLLQHELVEPSKLWQLYRLVTKWKEQTSPGGGISAFIDIRFDRQVCAAVMALLLGVPNFLEGYGRSSDNNLGWQIWTTYLALGSVLVWLLVLALMYSAIQRIAGGKILRHYNGKCTHGQFTGLLGGYIIGSSSLDSHVPGGTYHWVPNASSCAQDAGYGCILCA